MKESVKRAKEKFLQIYGGEGSGNFDHAGIPGHQGGSAKDGSGGFTTITTTVDKLKVGDRLKDGTNYGYGHYINIFVHSIRITKGGRFDIVVKQQYEANDGTLKEPQIIGLTNGPVIGTTNIEIIKQ